MEKRPVKYYSAMELCEILDVSERYLRKAILPNISEDHIDRSSNKHFYYGRAVMEAWRKKDKNTRPDELLMGDDSPAIEKYREIQYLRIKIKYEEELGRLLPVDVIHTVLSRISASISVATTLLRKQFGDNAASLIEDTLDSIEEATDELCAALEEEGDFSADENALLADPDFEKSDQELHDKGPIAEAP